MEIASIAAALAAFISGGVTYKAGVLTERRRHFAREMQTRREVHAMELSLKANKPTPSTVDFVRTGDRPISAATDHGFATGGFVGSTGVCDSGSSSSSSDSGSYS